MDLDIFNPSQHLRRAVLFWLSMFLTGAALIITYLTISDAQSSKFPVIELMFGLFSAYVCYQTYRDQGSEWLRKSYVWSFMVTVCWTVTHNPITYGVYVWANLIPIMCYLILGKKSAKIVTPCGLFAITVLIAVQMNQQAEFHIQLLFNFVLSYLSIWATTHILEVKRTNSESSLGKLASRDALTGVYNRHALVHSFERYRQESQKLPLSLLILDLDYFKRINDAHGHDVGDRVLVQTASLLDSLSDEHLVYRIGGEEFCIALHNTSSQQAKMKAEYIRFSIENHSFQVDEQNITLTVSIGVYQCHHFNSLESVLRKADIELYRAKRSGRNQVMMSRNDEGITDAI
ncbi:GGDEF domain-containing protein [Vibrio sp. 404]|uniref:diguanylate cyclase n=1 Tax=Vibrio marinisediminis TaxID=2758441 RepID=A0A7W2IUF7_9VIBR|nr:GGDEF domain-containing protein [Vibrio marinisediminis]